MSGPLTLADWRRRVGELYAQVRAAPDPERAHAHWCAVRDELFAHHAESPLAPGDPLARDGLSYFDYDASLRFEVEMQAVWVAYEPRSVLVSDGPVETTLVLVGIVDLPAPVEGRLGVWSLRQYGGGLFVPVRDATAGTETYGGGRYVLDTAKGADLGGHDERLVLDFNFAYHPSCRYDARWNCPLAPPENVLATPIRAGERC